MKKNKPDGFKLADNGIKRRLIVSIEGLEKTGKTHLALTAPGPIALLDFDMGLEGVVHKFTDKKEIFISTFDVPANKESKDSVDYDFLNDLVRFKQCYKAAINCKSVRTIVIDTSTESWDLMRIVRLGKLSQVKPIHYGLVNAEYRELLRLGFNSDKNIILIHKVKPEYINEKYTGNFVRSGFSEAGYLVQMNLRCLREGSDFYLEVLDCRHQPSLNEEVLEGELASFPNLASLVFPDTDPDVDWV